MHHRGQRELPGRHQPDRRARALLLPVDLEQPPQGGRARPQDRRRAEARAPIRSARRSTSTATRRRSIGVMEKKGQNLGKDFDDLVFVPFELGVNLFGRDAGRPGAAPPPGRQRARASTQVKDGITRLLRQRHHIPNGEPDDFQIHIQDEILKTVNTRPRQRHRGGRRRRRHRAAGRRHRHHEHHAGVGDRAHPRDRHAQGGRRAPPGRPRPVPDRGRHPRR